MFRTILFDFDGTLCPSLDCWLSAFVFAFDKYGIVLDEDEIIRNCFYTSYARIAAHVEIESSERLERDVYEGLEIAFRSVQLFSGVFPLLEDLHARGVAMGVVTSSPRALVTPTLRALGIAPFFGAVVGSEDTTAHKPDPEPIRLALQRLERGPERGVFVGDYVVDVHAGRAAGLSTALHLPPDHQRYYDFEHLRGAEPDFEFTEYEQLAEYLGAVAR
jgi:pyrophosphatase PpaX